MSLFAPPKEPGINPDTELSRDGVMRRYRWTRRELDEMIANVGFPAGDWRYMDNTLKGGELVSALAFRRDLIEQWENRIRKLAARLK